MTTRQTHTAFEDFGDATALPKLVRIGDEMYAAAFTLMKLLPARHIIDSAIADGRIKPGTVVVETTSGTFGLGLAIQCALRGIQLHLVSDPVIEGPVAERIRDLGAKVDVVRHPAPVGGYQTSRLERLDELMHSYPDAFCPRQYDNPENPTAYAQVAEQVLEALGPIDHVVGPVGSGGSMCGLTRALRRVFPNVTATGIDTAGSILFAAPEGKRLLRGLGNGLIPGNLDHTTFDTVHWVSEDEALEAARALHRDHALYMGPTSGAAYKVAGWESLRRLGRTLVIMPDEGHRYESQLWGRPAVSTGRDKPVLVDHPRRIDNQWCYYEWDRRTLAEVHGA